MRVVLFCLCFIFCGLINIDSKIYLSLFSDKTLHTLKTENYHFSDITVQHSYCVKRALLNIDCVNGNRL